MDASQEELPPARVASTFSALSGAFEHALTAVEKLKDPQQAYEAATRLADLLREAAELAAALRPRMAVRIWREEKISIDALAARIGVSKARAGQLVQRGRRAEDQSD